MAASGGDIYLAEELYLPVDVRDFGKKLYLPIRASNRIKYSCFAVSSHLLVLGANTGGVYVFIKHPLNYINFIPNKERDIQIARFSPDDKYLAIGSGCGVIIVWELNVTHLQHSKKVLEVSEHRGCHISDIVWDNKGQQLFIGDNTGKVSVVHMPGVLPRTVLSSGGGIRLRKQGIILICETPVVQLDYENDHLLVSCRHKSAVMNLKREEVVSVGSQERDGLYGACFYRVTTTHPQVTKILSARPKARIWKASLDGKVEITHKLRDLLVGIATTPIYGINFESTNSEGDELDVLADAAIPNAFKRIRVIKLVHKPHACLER